MDNISIKSLFPKSIEPFLSYEGGVYQKDGLNYCSICNQAKQMRIKDVDHQDIIVRVICDCEKIEQLKYKQEKERREFKESLEYLENLIQAYTNPGHTLENDDSGVKNRAAFINRYIEKWQEAKENNLGILMYGDIGTGKTFYADCIVNALIEQMVYATTVSIAGLIDFMQNSDHSSEIIYALNQFELLVLDDLGSERNTSYGLERLYSIIDTRYQSGKPTIITTNLDKERLLSCTDIGYKRVYDRILEMCPISIPIIGESKRTQKASDRWEIAKGFLINE